ncbi:LacI family DNA-binding transcriptional regulator [soil metagenome]
MSRPATPEAKPSNADESATVDVAASDNGRQVTLHDVARLAGLSAMTAWRAVNTPDKVPAATVARVQDAVARSGYVPNLVAGGLRSRKSKLVAALVPTVAGPVFLETIESLTSELAARGYQLMLGQSGYRESREDALINAIVGRRPDGIVLTGILHSPAGRKRLQAARIPVVETWDLTDTPIDMVVGFSHADVGTAVGRYLMARGRKAPALIGGDDERALRRMNAFVAEVQAHGVNDVPRKTVKAPSTLGQGRLALRELLKERPDLDAVFCTSDFLALGVLTEAQAQGIAVPGRLAVVGFGDLAFASDLNPALTTVRIDGTRIGKLAAAFLVNTAAGEPQTERIIDVGFRIVERDSA